MAETIGNNMIRSLEKIKKDLGDKVKQKEKITDEEAEDLIAELQRLNDMLKPR